MIRRSARTRSPTRSRSALRRSTAGPTSAGVGRPAFAASHCCRVHACSVIVRLLIGVEGRARCGGAGLLRRAAVAAGVARCAITASACRVPRGPLRVPPAKRDLAAAGRGCQPVVAELRRLESRVRGERRRHPSNPAALAAPVPAITVHDPVGDDGPPTPRRPRSAPGSRRVRRARPWKSPSGHRSIRRPDHQRELAGTRCDHDWGLDVNRRWPGLDVPRRAGVDDGGRRRCGVVAGVVYGAGSGTVSAAPARPAERRLHGTHRLRRGVRPLARQTVQVQGVHGVRRSRSATPRYHAVGLRARHRASGADRGATSGCTTATGCSARTGTCTRSAARSDSPGVVAGAVAMAPRKDGKGYWVVDRARSRVRVRDARNFFGGTPALRSGEFVSTISATPNGGGYWLFTNRGRAFPFGNASSFGDMSGTALNGPIVASVATPTGHGYYMVGSDGGIFSFGDAHFHGSTGSHAPQQADRRHLADARRPGLLAGRVRRRCVRVQRAVPRLDGRHAPEQGRSTGWSRSATAT